MAEKKSQAQTNIRKLLDRHWQEIRRRNSHYSLRSFAKFLGISPATLSSFMSQKINLSPKKAAAILKKIDTPEKQIKDILAGYEVQYERLPATTEDRLAVVNHWYYLPILNVLEISGQHTAANVAKRLGLTKKVCLQAIAVLKRLNLVTEDEEGILHPTDHLLSVACFSRELKPYQMLFQYADLQKEFLETLNSVDDSHRSILYQNSHFSGMTITIDRALLPEAFARIQKFRRNLSNFLESSSQKKDVYRMQIELFPLSSFCETEES